MKHRPAGNQTFFDFSAAPATAEPVPKTNGHHNGHVARLKSRGQMSLFDQAPSDAPAASPPAADIRQPTYRPLPDFSSGMVAKARDILASIRTLKRLEHEGRAATDAEKDALARFCGFGPVALHLFPDPLTGKYKDGWQTLGEELRDLLTVEEYDSAKRTTFNAFYTSPVVMKAMHEGLARLGLPAGGTVLEPGCGIGRFAACAPASQRFIGVELDSLSARIAKALHPHHDIRNENFVTVHRRQVGRGAGGRRG